MANDLFAWKYNPDTDKYTDAIPANISNPYLPDPNDPGEFVPNPEYDGAFSVQLSSMNAAEFASCIYYTLREKWEIAVFIEALQRWQSLNGKTVSPALAEVNIGPPGMPIINSARESGYINEKVEACLVMCRRAKKEFGATHVSL